jgi:hypothetical protein
MKKSIISAIAVTAIFCAAPLLQSCSDTSSRTTYTTTSDPGYYPPSENSRTTYTTTSDSGYYAPSETTTTTTTRSDEPDNSVVGSTANAAGTIIAAPFRIVGDTLGILF